MKKPLKLLALSLALLMLASCAGGGNGDTPGEPSSGKGDTPKQTPEQVETQLVEETDLMARGYYYDEAIEKIKASGLEGEKIDAQISKLEGLKAGLVKYQGEAYHVFFHSLIIYPELAFDKKGHDAQGYNMWMTTVSEFKKMLPLLEERGFVLVDIESFITRGEDGKITKRDIYLPEGKKPLVISQDDVNYYDYMEPDGYATRLLINDQNEVVTEVRDLEGNVSNTYDGDVVPILDQYVKEHPEFSYKGAKGTLALTGYEGAYGYRITDLEGEELEAARETVVALTKRLNETGWKIACHSYTHNGYFSSGNATMAQLTKDTESWRRLISPYVGDPKLYISPFGWHMKNSDARMKYLISQGFDVYCPVERNNYTWYYEDGIIQSRFNLDGYSMFKRPEYVNKVFFDVSKVLDPARPTPNW